VQHEKRLENRSFTVSVVVPAKNEESVLRRTHDRLTRVLEDQVGNFEIVYVDDGSTDSTFELLCGIQSTDRRVKVVQLSRNFGQQVAITAGIEHASGSAVVVIDADLQDPPEVIPLMIDRWHEGFDVVYGVRIKREGETVFKLLSAKAFYWLVNRISSTPIPADTGDFRLMDRKVIDALLRMPERDRFLRGMVNWVGFRQAPLPYERSARDAGVSKYPLFKMLRLAMDGVTSFSMLPLKMATWLGFSASAIALLLICYAMFVHAFTNKWITGWTSLFIAILFMGGAQLICLGIIGEYVGRVYGETKQRPLYFVRQVVGVEATRRNQEEIIRAATG